MGYNKVVLLLNDAEHQVTQDPKGWWQMCKEAFYKLRQKDLDPKTHTKEPETFGFGSYCNHWQAVWEEHADVTALIMVGRNHATVLGSSFHGHGDEESKIKALKDVLDRMGYRIVKKSTGKRNSPSGSGAGHK